MTAEVLIRELADAGIALAANGDKLKVRGPTGFLTPDLRQRLIDRKPELLAALRLHAVGDPDRTVADTLRGPGSEAPAGPRTVCEYRLQDHPAQWLIVLGAPSEAFDHIRADLQVKFGGRLVQVRQHAVRKPR